MGDVGVRWQFFHTDGVGLGTAENALLLLEGKLLPPFNVVDPALGEDETAACPRLPFGDDGDLALPVRCGVTRAIDEAGHVEGLPVNERDGLPGNLHVSFEGLA